MKQQPGKHCNYQQIESRMSAFRLAYLHLTLVRSKGQDQGQDQDQGQGQDQRHTHFDDEYLANGKI